MTRAALVGGAALVTLVPVGRLLSAAAGDGASARPPPRPPAASADALESSAHDLSVTRTVKAAVTPTLKSPLEESALGRSLHWGRDPSTHKSWTPQSLKAAAVKDPQLATALRDMLRGAKVGLGTKLVAYPTVHTEGTLPGAPSRAQANSAGHQLDLLYKLAVASRFGAPELQQSAGAKAAQALTLWAKTYKPTGNPIDELRFINVFQAADLAAPYLSKGQAKTVQAWTRKFISKGDSFDLIGSEKYNNWNVWRLAVRGVAAEALGDKAEVLKTRKLLDAETKIDIRRDGSTYDFHERDAFHYHLYSLLAYEQLLLLAPQTISPSVRASVEKAVEFIKPYYLGKKSHVEFKHTRVGFDRARAQAGDPEYAPHRWDPADANKELRLANALFPKVRVWTGKAGNSPTDFRTVFNETLQER